jgi:hypothetical protein
MISAITSIEDDEKSTTSVEVDRGGLPHGERGHISRRYRGTNSSTNLHLGELFLFLKISL